MKVTILNKSKRSELTVPEGKTATVLDLKKAYSKKNGLSIHQLCFKNKSVTLDDDQKLLASYGVAEGAELSFKDFGPQIGYRTVFIIEYLGPLLIILGYSLRPSFLYGDEANAVPFTFEAKLGICCWTIHFLKRELETIFVHRFSRPTMPLFNLFKNSVYYWAFGAVIGYPLCHPDYTNPSSSMQVQLGLLLFAVSEVLNFAVHVQLRMLRPKEGSKLRPIPNGALFSLVSCPNYTFEVLGWIGFSLMTQIFGVYLFTLIGFLQMSDWALKKHSSYGKTYGDEYKKLRRKAIVPFLL